MLVVPAQPPRLYGRNWTSDTSLSIHWDPVPSKYINGFLVRYKVIYQLMRTSEKHVKHKENVIEIESRDNALSLTDLIPYSVYKFKISAATTVGYGPFDEIFLGKQS